MQFKTLASLALIVSCAIAATNALAQASIMENVDKIDVNGAQEYAGTEEDVLILDVRTPVEYEMSHIPDAVNLNVQDEAFTEMLAGLDKNKTYIVHCTKNPMDGRSSAALGVMQEQGFKNLYSMDGGYIAWSEAELPLVEPEPAN